MSGWKLRVHSLFRAPAAKLVAGWIAGVMAGNRVSNGLGVGLLAAAGLAASPLQAQSANDYRLPGATSTPDPRSAGPVDPSDPTVSAPRARTTPAPTPQPGPSVAAPTLAATAAPTPSISQPARQTAPRPVPARSNGPAPLPSAPASTPAASDQPPVPAATASESVASPPPAVQPTPEASLAPAAAFDWQPWAAGAAALLLAVLGGLWWRKRSAREPEVELEPPVVAASKADAEPQPAPAPPPAPASPKPAPLPPAAAAVAPTELALELDARRLTASLVATTLSYAVRLTNTGAQPLSALAIEADLVSAHSSLPVERQIASGDQRLELRHAQVELAPGESIEFTGDLRLPLTEITPIRSGSAAYFVPLARFRIESSGAVLVQTFVIGERPEQTGAALRPFRLDLGPRTYSQIGQRAVA